MRETNNLPLVLGIGGTTRENSTGQKALRVSLAEAEIAGCRTQIIAGTDLDLPLYSPNDSARSRKAARLVRLMRECEGLIICSPAYHGSVSGLVKNALDYAQDLSEDGRVYLDGVEVGCIACGAGWQAPGQTLSALRAITHALRGWPTPIGATLNSSEPLFKPDGRCADQPADFQLKTLARQVVGFAKMRRLAKAKGVIVT